MRGTGMDKILLSHGGGGRKTSELIENVFQTYFNDEILLQMDDSAVLDDIVFTTDTFVVTPLFFPGGDIGKLAVAGTVNDLSVMGAKPLYLSVAFIIEEGFGMGTLKKILQSIKESANECGVRIVTGDTKVVEKGKCDGIFINTSGIGKLNFKNQLLRQKIVPGDRIIINGNLGLHGISVLIARNEFGIDVDVKSDVAPLSPLLQELKEHDIKFMRDPTRGGLAQTLNELVTDKRFGIQINETDLPISPEVEGVCDILGFEPIQIANEGKVIVIASESDAENVLSVMKKHPLGIDSAIIGTVTENNAGFVSIRTSYGTERIVMPPIGELLPRIC